MGFLQDHSFTSRSSRSFPVDRCNLVDLNSVTHRSQKTSEFVYKPVMNLCSLRF
jgi:hypothetical protein